MVVRPAYEKGSNNYLFLSRLGRKMGPNSIGNIVKKYAVQSGIKKKVSTHTFRHSCATLMLRNGAPIRHLQEMLGHESITSTQIYTSLTLNDLKEAHRKYHPSEERKKT